MIVPRTKGAKVSQAKPSEEMMLMALAHMKDLGRISEEGQRPKPKLVSSQPEPSAPAPSEVGSG